MGILFRLFSGEKSLGMEKIFFKKSSNAIKYVGVFLLIYSRLFWCRISVEDFEAFPTLFSSKREKVAYLIIYFCPLWHFPSHCHKRLLTGFCLFGQGWAFRSTLSLTHTNFPSGHKSLFWRRVSVTKHGAIYIVVEHKGSISNMYSQIMAFSYLIFSNALLENLSKWCLWTCMLLKTKCSPIITVKPCHVETYYDLWTYFYLTHVEQWHKQYYFKHKLYINLARDLN